jgi:hypothetical protein
MLNAGVDNLKWVRNSRQQRTHIGPLLISGEQMRFYDETTATALNKSQTLIFFNRIS